MDTETCLIRLLIAGVLGSVIGVERDMHGRAAGLRTHMIVSVGAALFTIVSIKLSLVINGHLGDPGRIAAQVVTGIGFLGAGTILQTGVSVRGLTTAACLWIVAAIGMATAIGLYWVAVITACGSVIALVTLKNFENRMHRNYQLKVILNTATLGYMEEMCTFLKSMEGIKITAVNVNYDSENGNVETTFTMDTHTMKNQSELATEMTAQLSKKTDILKSFSLSCEG